MPPATTTPAHRRRAPRRAALRKALRAGEIDAVATDHAPHRPEEKAVDFAKSARGVIGLETAASVVWGLAEDPDLLFRTLSSRPAEIAALSRHGRDIEAGSPANLVVFDPDRRWVAERFISRSGNSPYLGREMRGIAALTIHEGRVVHALEGVA